LACGNDVFERYQAGEVGQSDFPGHVLQVKNGVQRPRFPRRQERNRGLPRAGRRLPRRQPAHRVIFPLRVIFRGPRRAGPPSSSERKPT
jgi:hypothetical protein